MAATYPPFATAAQYAEWTGAPAPAGIDDLLDGASTAIRRYCGWHIAPVVIEDVVVDGTGQRLVILPTLRLLNLLEIEERVDSITVAVYAPTDVEWSRDGYLRKPSRGLWTRWLRGVTASIEHGFADYGDLATMVLTMVARGAASPYGLTSQTVGSVSVGVSTSSGGQAGGIALTDDQAQTLDGYRLFGRP
jgi:hypothetical protein